MGIFQVIYMNMSADDAFKAVSPFKPFVPFRDASCGVPTFHLTVIDVLRVSRWHRWIHCYLPDKQPSISLISIVAQR
jgi:hypothetical protein